MNKQSKKKAQAQKKMLAAVSGRERDTHFAAGGSVIGWRNGGRRVWTQKNGKAVASKNACRGSF
jgi:hypothetical protein